MWRIIFAAMIAWHFLGHFSALLAHANTPLGEFWIGPPWCWLVGSTSFSDAMSYNAFWSFYIALTGITGLCASMIRR